jgi:hypothetical protein
MANGEYNAKSAYAAQFAGSYADYEWNKVWQAKVEEKCKFFYWLFIQNKVWTADGITIHGGTTNTVCQLYYTQPESLLHMLAQCSYSKMIWTSLSAWMGTNLQPPPPNTNIRLGGATWQQKGFKEHKRTEEAKACE